MQVLSDIKNAKYLCQTWRNEGLSIAFVPTMGCLHDGHLSLIKKAQSLADRVVVSIFVNPLQFDNKDDLLTYPSTLDEDITKLSNFGVDFVFTPDAKSFYPEGESKVEQIEVGTISSLLEGDKRPGHFAGVATVVKRLFEIVQPKLAIFGEKDFQQVIVIEQLVKQFNFDIEIVAMPTSREADGLAMSSRNIRLNESERKKASLIYKQLKSIKTALNKELVDYGQFEHDAYENLVSAGFIPDYVVIRDASTLLPPNSHTDSLVVLIAAKLGQVRLIDNIRV